MAKIGYVGPYNFEGGLLPGAARWVQLGQHDGLYTAAVSISAIPLDGKGGDTFVLKVENINTTMILTKEGAFTYRSTTSAATSSTTDRPPCSTSRYWSASYSPNGLSRLSTMVAPVHDRNRIIELIREGKVVVRPQLGAVPQRLRAEPRPLE
jgi:hypothetical protein